MKVLILGEAKSGTTMLFQRVSEARDTPFEQRYFEPDDLEALDLSAPELVVKKLMAALRPSERGRLLDFDRRVLLVRDPRDRLVSWMLYDIHGHGRDLDDEALERYLDLLRRKEADPAGIPFIRLTHAYWRLTGVDLLTSLARSSGRMADLLGRYKDLFHLVHYEQLIAGDTGALEAISGSTPCRPPMWPPISSGWCAPRATGDWRHWFTRSDLQWLRPMVQSTLRRLEYSREWDLADDPAIDPEHASLYVERLVAEARAEDEAPGTPSP